MFQAVRRSEWSANHIAEHGVTLHECGEVIVNRPYINEPGESDSRLIFGKTESGRMLLVVAVADPDDPMIAFVVTAREMTNGERKSFRKRLHKKGKRK